MPGDEDLDEEQLLAREEAMKAEEALMADLRRKQAEMEAIRQREAQNAKVARRRVQHQWLKIMRQAKADELLVKPVPSLNLVSTKEAGYVVAEEAKEKGYTIAKLSGTKFRQMLRAGEEIPEWFAFKSVVDVLRADRKSVV